MDFRVMSRYPARTGERDAHLENQRLIEGTLPFGYLFDTIPLSDKLRLDIKELKPLWTNFFPFNAISIINIGGTDIKVYFNDDKGDNWVFVPNNGTKDLILPYNSIRTIIVENLSTTLATTADKIAVEVYDTGRTADEKAKRGVF